MRVIAVKKTILQELLETYQLQHTQDVMARLLGVGIITLDANGNPVTKHSNLSYYCNQFIAQNELGCKLCNNQCQAPHPSSHKGYSSYSCPLGLTYFSLPFKTNNKTIGYINGGQVLTHIPSSEEIHNLATKLMIDANTLEPIINKVPFVSSDRLKEIAESVIQLIQDFYFLAYDSCSEKRRNIELERTTELKSHFLANMSHEIRTPMNAIIGMAEMALREDLPINAREDISQIKASGKILLTIINDILDFSKIESGKLEITNVEYEVLSLINDVVNTINTRIGDKDIKLIINLDPNIPHKLYGDDVRIKQIILNLANNAVKFTPSGYVIISMKGIQKNNKFHLKVSVKDTGIGIKEEDMHRLFGLFEQLDSKRNRNIEGTGLGLRISKELLSLMNGNISVSSIYGEGSEFYFNVPQLIVRDTPCGLLNDSPNIFNVIGIIDDALVEDSLSGLLSRLHVQYTSCHSTEDLSAYSNATHIFVSESFYKGEIKNFLFNVDAKVAVVIDNNHSLTVPSKFKTLKMPLYCLNVINFLNNIDTVNHELSDLDMITFQAPTARILIVDDNSINITVAMGLLDPLNLQCDSALSGDEAIEKVKKHTYDIIFMDHMMPGKDGVETTHEIRALPIPYCSTVPIIALSANALRGAREMFIDEGMNDFISKPIEFRNMISKIREWLPSNKIIKLSNITTTPDSNSIEDKIPKIAGLDTEFGLSMAGNIDIYQKILLDYYQSISKKADLISSYEQNEDIKNFTIEVHALKSTSKLIGALELSFLAEKLEHAGTEHNLELIHNETDSLLRIYRGYSHLLRPYIDSLKIKSPKPKIYATDEVLHECLSNLSNALKDFDIDKADELIDVLQGYNLSLSVKGHIDALSQAILDLNYDEGIRLISELLK